VKSKYIIRKNQPKQLRDKMLIVCTGQTEEIYFNFIKNKYKNSLLKITIDVITHKRNTPMTIVKRAIENINEYKEVWVVFDRDEALDFDEAVRSSYLHGIKCAFSNRQIEYWFLLHFVYTTADMNREKLESELNRYLKFKYDKDETTLNKVYSKIFKNLSLAEIRAKEGFIKQKAVHKSKPSDWCSCTTVYQLTETMKKWNEAK